MPDVDTDDDDDDDGFRNFPMSGVRAFQQRQINYRTNSTEIVRNEIARNGSRMQRRIRNKHSEIDVCVRVCVFAAPALRRGRMASSVDVQRVSVFCLFTERPA